MVKRIWTIILIYLGFLLFWLLFYTVAGTFNSKYTTLFSVLKILSLQSIGFVVAVLAATLLFPLFILKKRYLSGIAVLLLLLAAGTSLIIWINSWTDFISPQKILAKGQVAMVNMKPPKIIYFNFFLTSLLYILLGLGFAYMKDWFAKDRKTNILEKEKMKAELTLLRYQLNPHFLFNSINNIYYLAIIKSDKTPEALLKLSDLLRYVLNEKEEIVPLDQEIEYLKKFIALHQIRFPDYIISFKLFLKQDIAHLYIPPLLLITFVENAFKHGVSGIANNPLEIELTVQDNLLTYIVRNQIGETIIKENTTGIGLSNLQKRLTLIYPEKHILVIENNKNIFTAILKIRLT